MKTKIIILGAIVLAYFAAALITLPRGSDEEKIRNLIADIAASVERHEAAPIIARLSKDYKDEEGRDYMLMRAYVIDVIYSNKKRDYAVTTKIHTVKVKGDTAVAYVLGKAEWEDEMYSYLFDLRLVREKRYRFFVIPTAEWRLTAVN
ncbi:MAG: hypothetical protein J6X38_04095 [Abditibacteriota bacterium]|nr:hypothetical protein [Abditibacteriota bacterium]